MTSKVNNFLNFDRECIGENEFIAIGQCHANGGFFIHHLICSALREKKCVLLLSLVQKFHHYNSIARKLGTNLLMAQNSKQFVFLDGLDVLLNEFFLEDSTSDRVKHTDTVKRLREQILSTLTQFINSTSTTPLLLIDDMSVLLNVGLGFDAVGVFVSSLVSGMDLMKSEGSDVSSKIKTKRPSVVVLSSYAEEDRDSVCLWKLLSHMSSISVNVTGLQTGYCKDVHGQVTAVWNDKLDLPRPSHRKTLQFKISETSVDFFASGMSPAVL